VECESEVGANNNQKCYCLSSGDVGFVMHWGGKVLSVTSVSHANSHSTISSIFVYLIIGAMYVHDTTLNNRFEREGEKAILVSI
jgi:hypothetical protein